MAAEKHTFLELAAKVLEEAQRPLSPNEIWNIAVSKGYELLLHSRGQTPANTMYTSILVDCRRPESKFIRSGDRPARYYLKSLSSVGRDRGLK